MLTIRSCFFSGQHLRGRVHIRSNRRPLIRREAWSQARPCPGREYRYRRDHSPSELVYESPVHRWPNSHGTRQWHQYKHARNISIRDLSSKEPWQAGHPRRNYGYWWRDDLVLVGLCYVLYQIYGSVAFPACFPGGLCGGNGGCGYFSARYSPLAGEYHWMQFIPGEKHVNVTIVWYTSLLISIGGIGIEETG